MEPEKKERAAESVYASSLYFAGGAFARQVEKLAAEIWKPTGLTPSQAHLLLRTIDNYFSFPVYITKDLWVSPSTITRLVEKLEKKGLAWRCTEDRGTYIVPTDKGRELKPVLEKCEKNFMDRCNELFGEKQALALAGRLNAATDKLAESAG